MNKYIKFLILVVCIITISAIDSYSQLAVVVGKNSSNSVDKSSAQKMFTGEKLTWSSGKKVVVVDQGNSSVGAEFYKKFLSTTVNAIRAAWAKLVLSGQAAAPIKCDDSNAVKNAVNKDPNAIGYIKLSEVDDSVKMLFKIE